MILALYFACSVCIGTGLAMGTIDPTESLITKLVALVLCSMLWPGLLLFCIGLGLSQIMINLK